MKNKILVCFVVCVVIVAVGGCETETDDPMTTQTEVVDFSDAFVKVGEVVPEQPDSLPLVRLSGTDFDSRGNMAVADNSESNVKIYDESGRLIRSLGRPGRGPGEFQGVRYPRFGDGDTLYVADDRDRSVSIFVDGDFLDRIPLQDLGFMSGFDLLSDGRFILTGRVGSDTSSVLYVYDRAGTLVGSHLPIAATVPDGESNGPVWEMLRAFRLGVSNDTAYVVSTVSDSLWMVAFPSGNVERIRIPIPDYSPARLPDRIFATPAEASAHDKSFHAAATPVIADVLVVPFVKGVLNYGDTSTVMVRNGDRWFAVRGAPPIVRSVPTGFLTIENPLEEHIRLGRYRWRVDQ